MVSFEPRVKHPCSSAVQVEGLCYSYGHQEVLHCITFSITPGTVVGLLGPNGAGKTTTLKLLTGIMKPGAGWISRGGFKRQSRLG
jgi:ABC-type multidrug transport system ATPase subunit